MQEQTSFPVAAPAFFYTNADTTAACLQALFRDSPVATVAFDARHRFVMCNQAFENLYWFSPEELMTSDLDKLIAGPETRDEALGLSRAVLRGEKVHTVTKRCRRDGMVLDVEIHGIPLIVENTIAGVIALYQNVTERNQAQTAYRQLSRKLNLLQEEERRITAHESATQERECVVSQGSATVDVKSLHRPPAQRGLTARESEVLILLAEGLTSRQIAGTFGISIRTVESHRIHINHKLGFTSLAELVRYAVRHCLIT